MNRGTNAGRLSILRRWPWAVATMLLGLLGCFKPQARLQSEDEPAKYELDTIKQYCGFANIDPQPVVGVALVTGLNNTGSAAPAGDLRSMLEKELYRDRVEHVRELLSRTDTSLVLVQGIIPPGSHHGDPIDIEVTLPPGSKTTSLRGGTLERCRLFTMESAGRVNSAFEGSDLKLQGYPLVEIKEARSLEIDTTREDARQARVWGAGTCRIDWTFYVVMNPDNQQAVLAKQVADRLNENLRGGPGLPGTELAKAKSKELVHLGIPPQYRLNLQRYLRVASLVPMQDPQRPLTKAAAEAARTYLRRLEEEVKDPAHTVTASLRLEALGEMGRSSLKKGLKSDHTLVRFCCAEALAYEGEGMGAAELGRLAAEQPALRAFCLTALASLDESISYETLGNLMSSTVPELRYGAFRALRALNEKDPLVRGELLNDSYWIHRVPGSDNAPGLIHISTSNRAEIVLFGDDQELNLTGPFVLRAGEFNVTAGVDDVNRCVVSRFSTTLGRERKYSSLKVEDMIRTMARMGASYTEVSEALRQARGCACVKCPVESDALPQAISVEALHKAGQRSGNGLGEDDLLAHGTDLGGTPFDRDPSHGLRPSDAEVPEPKAKKTRKGGDRGTGASEE
jgi:Flagellar P-ring protein